MGDNNVVFPDESRPHDRTFMSFPEEEVWGEEVVNIRHDIISVAKAISAFETVSLLVSPRSKELAQELIGNNENIKILDCNVNDLWARDTLPGFLLQRNPEGSKQRFSIVAVNLNFNGWGKKQEEREHDVKVASTIIEHFKLDTRTTWLVGECGGLEFDGESTVLGTRSSWINENRNPGRSESEITDEIKRVFNVRKVIWFDGIKNQDITDAHIDSIVRFIRPGRVLLSRPCPAEDPDEKDIWEKCSDEAFKILKEETDADGRHFEIVEIHEPDPTRYKPTGDPNKFVSAYVNYLVANRCVIIPKFGDQIADDAAVKIFVNEFPKRDIVQVAIPWIASGGGGIHCATHEFPATNQ